AEVLELFRREAGLILARLAVGGNRNGDRNGGAGQFRSGGRGGGGAARRHRDESGGLLRRRDRRGSFRRLRLSRFLTAFVSGGGDGLGALPGGSLCGDGAF